MRYLTLLLACLSLSTFAFGEENWETQFQQPPMSARPQTWWHWMDGNVTREGITKDLEAMKNIGIGGFQAFSISDNIPQGPAYYMSDEWRTLMAHAANEAERLDLQMCLHNCAGWSSSGGPWITPEESMKELVWSEQEVQGSTTTIQTKQPASRHDFYRDICVLAFPTPTNETEGQPRFYLDQWRAKAGFGRKHRLDKDPRTVSADMAIKRSDIVNLTDRLGEDGTIQWSVPTGSWTILRLGYTTNGRTNGPAPKEGRGLECDKLSTSGAELHWKSIVQKVLDDAGPNAGQSLNNILIDSYETGEQNWTRNFNEEFQSRRGYELLTYLPTITGRVVENVEVTERFLWDFRRTIADLFCKNYYGHFAKLCHERGLKLSIEPYGGWTGNFHDVEIAEVADIPMGEFWSGQSMAWYESSVKLAASAAHSQGNKYVGAESFTAGPQQGNWMQYPGSLKAQGDYFFSKGLNRIIFHTYAHKPWGDNVQPGMTMSRYGMQFNRKNTWFSDGQAWISYLARCQHLLQQGDFIADLCYVWNEDAPNQLKRRDQLVPLPPKGHDYDGISIKTMMQMTVKDGWVMLPSGMRYRILVLSEHHTMRPEVLRKIQQLVDDGATVWGDIPTISPSLQNYPACDEELQQLRAKLIASNGMVTSENPLASLLEEHGILPDFELPTHSTPDSLRYLHRRIDDTDVYFISNQLDLPIQAECIFRTTGTTPELWHPVSGKKEEAVLWQSTSDNRTMTSLQFGPEESLFVVFKKTSKAPVHAVIANGPTGQFLKDTNLPEIKILDAAYGLLSGTPNQKADVTDILRKQVALGSLVVHAGNNLAGDPAVNLVKELGVRYEIDGVEQMRIVKEGGKIKLTSSRDAEAIPAAKLVSKDNQLELHTYVAGDYSVTLSDGTESRVTVDNLSPPLTVKGPWQVTLTDEHNTGKEDVSIKLQELQSLSEHSAERVQYFAGKATYETSFSISNSIPKDKRFWLDLGSVEIMAKVEINGTPVGTLWHAPYQADITSFVEPGLNKLTVHVTTLWPNRLIGDERLNENPSNNREQFGSSLPDWVSKSWEDPKEADKTFTVWRHWLASDDLIPTGLIGPVQIHMGVSSPLVNRTSDSK